MTTRNLYSTIHQCRNCSALHPHWDCTQPPAMVVAPGETFTMTSPDAANGMLTRTSTAQDIARIDYRKLDPLCGPVHVEGAQPGDVLKIEVLDLALGDWGWTGLISGFGLLHEDFTEPYYHAYDLNGGNVEVLGESFALNPMLGVLGTAPLLPGPHPSVTPTVSGGNMDVRYLQKGATVYLPVFHDGALLSAGDGHALQGEGEISGVAIEAPMTATLRVEILKQRPLRAPFMDISTKTYTETEYRTFLGIGPDLMTAAKDATRFAVEELAASLRVSPLEAYAAFGLVAELRIHEIVDQPNWIVGCMLPRRFFRATSKSSGFG